MLTDSRRLSASAIANALQCSPVGLARLTIGLFVASLVAVTTADADLWGHLRFGLDILESWTIHNQDPYSFTSDSRWINHEWLAELLMAAAYTALGPLGLNLLKVACIAVVTTVAVVTAREEGATPLARDIFVALVVFSAYTRMQAVRPQLFSVALFSVLLYLMRQVDRGRLRSAWGIPPLFAAWVNLHGGWLVGLACTGAWLAVRMLERVNLRLRLTFVAVGAAVVLATLVNPYGVGLWSFLASTVGLARPGISDWKPLLELPSSVLVIETILPTVALLCMWNTTFRVPPRYVAILGLLVYATFRVGRTDAFAHVAIGTLLAPQLIGGLGALEQRLSAVRPGFWRAVKPVGILAVCLMMFGGVTLARSLPTITIQGHWIPDPESALFLREHYPGARVLTWFDWGEYAVWHLSPTGARVSLDGRRETVYSERVIADHYAFYRARPGADDYPDRIAADVVWLPREFPSIRVLHDRGWVPVFENNRSVVMARSRPRTIQPTRWKPAQRLFPGP